MKLTLIWRTFLAAAAGTSIFSFSLAFAAETASFAKAGSVSGAEARQSRAAYSPPKAGLIGRWKADGNAVDSAGSHDGILEGGMGFVPGILGEAFDAGSDKRVYIPDSPDFQLTSLTIGAWVNITANSWTVVSRGDDRSGLDPYNLALDNNGNMMFIIESASQENDSIQAPIAYGEWHQITATLDGSTHDMRLYIDGELVARKTTTVVPMLELDPSQEPGLGIGNVPATYDFPLLGSIDEVVLYDRALSRSAIRKLATIRKPKKLPRPLTGLHDR
jgi:hypothetical protein